MSGKVATPALAPAMADDVVVQFALGSDCRIDLRPLGHEVWSLRNVLHCFASDVKPALVAPAFQDSKPQADRLQPSSA